ncbi:uncharacterized protein RSE6_08322 [Rhynchosporium secalis]|uniref:Uncharacterized protein n=1 Tax=Rhynchosporium secalis TaxID=38038 RepID=A0A1E1MF53_RHYSE|nr:uncharacterized protein RSE6_08322 [Rhynchosporium secalis]
MNLKCCEPPTTCATDMEEGILLWYMNGFAWLWSAKAVRRRPRGFCTGDVVPAKIAGWEVELCD